MSASSAARQERHLPERENVPPQARRPAPLVAVPTAPAPIAAAPAAALPSAPDMPLTKAVAHVSAGILTIELRSRLLRRVHYDHGTRRMGVVLRTGKLLVYPDVPAILPDMIGRHPAPGFFYKETLRPLLERPCPAMSKAVLGFRWRLRKAEKASGIAKKSLTGTR